MNQRFKTVFGSANPTLPLQPSGNIVHGNACRVDWELVCPKKDGDEIYILGNPPFIGKKEQSKKNKTEIEDIFSNLKGVGVLDYVACWYVKAAQMMIGTTIKCAFVSTNSIVQGEQTGILWEYLVGQYNVNIFFAHRTFQWNSQAKGKAAVHCVIIGFSYAETSKKTIFDHTEVETMGRSRLVKNINGYLFDAKNVIVKKRTLPISDFPKMIEGITPLDNGILSFSESEYHVFIEKEPQSKKFFRTWITGDSFINSYSMYCLWLVGITRQEIENMPFVAEKLKQVRVFRENSKSSQQFSNTPWLFRETTIADNYILIPKTSSENRNYIPIGFITNAVTSSSSLMLNNASVFHFAILSSKIHMAWMSAVCGRLESRYRYSASIVFNNFPFPPISDNQKAELEQSAYRILEARERYTEKTLAQLYDPDKMPADLRAAHERNDLAVERCYRSRPFSSDEERLEYLFKLYEQMIADENAQQGLFAVAKKVKGKAKVKWR